MPSLRRRQQPAVGGSKEAWAGQLLLERTAFLFGGRITAYLAHVSIDTAAGNILSVAWTGTMSSSSARFGIGIDNYTANPQTIIQAQLVAERINPATGLTVPAGRGNVYRFADYTIPVNGYYEIEWDAIGYPGLGSELSLTTGDTILQGTTPGLYALYGEVIWAWADADLS